MDKHKAFARNLEALQKASGQSLGEFAEEVGVAKSTMRSVRLSGNTTLDTAIRISEGLNLPLDSLVGDSHLAKKVDIVEHLLQSVDWLRALSDSERDEVALHFRRIVEVVCK